MRGKYHLQALGHFGAVLGTMGLAILLVSLTGCDEYVVTKSERITMEVVGVTLRSKSNSKVDLKVVGQPVTYYNERLSCSKTKARNVRIGSKWDVVVEDYKWGDRYGSRLRGTDAICTLSN